MDVVRLVLELQCYTIRKEVALLGEIEMTFALLRNPKHMPEVEGGGGRGVGISILSVRFNPTYSFICKLLVADGVTSLV